MIGITIIGLLGLVIGNWFITGTIDGTIITNTSAGNQPNPFQTWILACEIVVIIAMTLFAMKKLFSTGVLSKFDEEDQGGI